MATINKGLLYLRSRSTAPWLPLTSRTAVLLVDLRIVVVGEDVLAVGDEVFQILVGNSHGVFTIGREGLNHKTKIKVLTSLIVIVFLPKQKSKY